MDIPSLITNIAILSLVFVPYFIIIYIGNRQFKDVGKRFQQEVQKHGLHIDEYERWNMNAMGMDSKQQKILLVVKRNKQMLAEVISLKNIKESAIVTCTNPVNAGNKATPELERIFLELTPLEGTDKILVSLFDSEYTFEQDFEMKHAEKWNNLINSSILKPQQKEKAA